MKMVLKKTTKLRRAVTVVVALVGLLAATALAASPEPEATPAHRDFTIGAVYTTLDRGYFLQGVRHQSFDRSHQRVLAQLAEERGFGLREHYLSSDPATHASSAAQLPAWEVTGALVFQSDPVGLDRYVRELRQRQIPVVIQGVRYLPEPAVPYVGDDALVTGWTLGRAAAIRFTSSFPGRQARLMIANTRTIERNRRLEEGFIGGFQEVLPEAEVLPVRDDLGSAMNARDTVALALGQHPEVNVLVGMSDFRTIGIIDALHDRGRGRPDRELVASVGGSEEAMRALLDANSPWKVQAGLAVGDMVREGYELLRQMITGSRPIDSSVEILVTSQVLVAPTFEEVADYLRIQHGIEEFALGE